MEQPSAALPGLLLSPFAPLAFEIVVFLADPQNLRSQRAVEKIGGVPVGSRLDAGGRPSVAYQIDASTFDGSDLVRSYTHSRRPSHLPGAGDASNA